jgi:hypothetical protein
LRRAPATTSMTKSIPTRSSFSGALRDVDIEGRLCVWDDRSVAWSDFEMVVIRSTWDYTKDRRAFLEWARSLPTLFNPYEVIEYSTDKHYLNDLMARGHRIIPTLFCDVGETPDFPRRWLRRETDRGRGLDGRRQVRRRRAREGGGARRATARLGTRRHDPALRRVNRRGGRAGTGLHRRKVLARDSEECHAPRRSSRSSLALSTRATLARRRRTRRRWRSPSH